MKQKRESYRRVVKRGSSIVVFVVALCAGSIAAAQSDDIAAIEAKADAIEAKADAIEAKADALEVKADVLEAKADALEAKADQSTAALAALEAKADALEVKADQSTAALEAIEAKLDALEPGDCSIVDDVAALEAKVDAIEAKIDALDTSGGDQFQRDMEKDLLFDDRIAFWYLPQSLGGHLEDVRQKVLDTQAAVAASGEAIQPTFQNRFNQAELFRSNNQFRRAFDNYAVAYCLLVSVPGEPCPR